MTLADLLLPEFDLEMANTRKVLEQVPDDKLDWKAHPKSNTIGWVGSHLAEIVNWVEGTLTQDSWDIQPPGQPAYRTPLFGSRQEMLERFDAGVKAGRAAIEATSDESFAQSWSLLMAGNAIFTMPRSGVIRNFVLNHTIHHRAFLCCYLRLNDIAVPGMYGPSGDE